MEQKTVGAQTRRLRTCPSVLSFAAVGGRFEGEGPLREYFDELSEDHFFGEKTWEKGESTMQRHALSRALEKGGLKVSDLDLIFAGDLLNQCVGSSFALRESRIPFYGLYGACSTMGESLSLAALMLDGGYASCAAALTSSHFCTAERQYRMPVPYGSQRTPTVQWTATGSGCCLLACEGEGPYITHVTTGKIVDKGVTDANNMGAAMAPAAYDTLCALFRDTRTKPEDYDLIVTGDLGRLGHQIVSDFFARDGSATPTAGFCSTTSNRRTCTAAAAVAAARQAFCAGICCAGCARANGTASSSRRRARCSPPRRHFRARASPASATRSYSRITRRDKRWII